MNILNPAGTDLTVEDATTAADYQAFADINRQWVERFFNVEADDEKVFRAPRQEIVDKGGVILVAKEHGDILGACALVSISDGDFEFSKMGVRESARGMGVGRRLLEAGIEKACTLGAKKLLICTSSSLLTANRMYRRFGFTDSNDPRHHAYDRADVFLELTLT